jgi:hypothetical protein
MVKRKQSATQKRLRQKVSKRKAATAQVEPSSPKIIWDDSPEPPRLGLSLETELPKHQTSTVAGGIVAVLTQIMERMALQNQQSKPLVIGDDPLETLSERSFQSKKRRFERKYRKMFQLIRVYGATFWDVECVILLLEAYSPEIFLDEMAIKLTTTTHGWISQITLSHAGRSGPTGLEDLEQIMKTCFNNLIVAEINRHDPNTTERVRYFEEFMMANVVPESFREMIAQIQEASGFELSVDEMQNLLDRIEIRIGSKFKESSRQVIKKLMDTAQIRCRSRVARNLTQFDRVRDLARVINPITNAIYASIFYSLFGMRHPVWYNLTRAGSQEPVRVVGQCRIPVVHIIQDAATLATTHGHMIVDHSNGDMIGCTVLGPDPSIEMSYEWPIRVSCLDAIQYANQALKDSLGQMAHILWVLDYSA